jgi:hypothetical protein
MTKPLHPKSYHELTIILFQHCSDRDKFNWDMVDEHIRQWCEQRAGWLKRSRDIDKTLDVVIDDAFQLPLKPEKTEEGKWCECETIDCIDGVCISCGKPVNFHPQPPKPTEEHIGKTVGELKKQIKDLLAQGVSRCDISSRTGLTLKSIQSIIDRNHLEAKPPKPTVEIPKPLIFKDPNLEEYIDFMDKVTVKSLAGLMCYTEDIREKVNEIIIYLHQLKQKEE